MKHITFGCVGLVITAISGLFYYNSRKQARRQIPSRELIISLIKKLHNEMFNVFLVITSFVQNYNSTGLVPPDQLKAIILQNISEKVFTEISQQQFEYSLRHDYENDNEIKYILRQYEQELQKSFLGVKPQIKEKNIVFLSKQQILYCVNQLLNKKIERLEKKQLHKKSQSQLKDILEQDSKQDKQQRNKILKQLGIKKQPIKVFQFCVAKYSRMDQDFLQKYNLIFQQYKIKIQKIIP